jgi:hypothetical protein
MEPVVPLNVECVNQLLLMYDYTMFTGKPIGATMRMCTGLHCGPKETSHSGSYLVRIEFTAIPMLHIRNVFVVIIIEQFVVILEWVHTCTF